MSNENGKPKVDDAQHVEHADVVENADSVESVHIDALGAVGKRWYWPITFATVAALGGIVMLAGALVITIQRADRAERAVAKAEQAVDQAERAVAEQAGVALEEQERDACYDRYVALTADSGVNSRISLNQLVIVLADSITEDLTEAETNRRITAGVADLRAVDLQARSAVEMRQAYLADEQPLPCPLTSTLEPVGD